MEGFSEYADKQKTKLWKLFMDVLRRGREALQPTDLEEEEEEEEETTAEGILAYMGAYTGNACIGWMSPFIIWYMYAGDAQMQFAQNFGIARSAFLLYILFQACCACIRFLLVPTCHACKRTRPLGSSCVLAR